MEKSLNHFFTSPEEATIARIIPTDRDSAEILRQLADWNYAETQSATAAYDNPGIERLQLLRQIKALLRDGMGFSGLYNILKERRGQKTRLEMSTEETPLQAWGGLYSSVVLREFAREHSQFLGGFVDSNNKWRYRTEHRMIGDYTKMQHASVITRPAALVKQGNLKLYTTSLTISDLLIDNFYSIIRLDPSLNQKGYQRLLNEGRARKLAKYIVEAYETKDAFLPTSIFIATDKDIPYNSKNHTITIDVNEICPFNVVDGQHRIEGLRMAVEMDERVLGFEIPVNIAVNLTDLSQMCHFLIVNTTQKSVDKAVEQRIFQRLTKALELEDLPSLPRWIQKIISKGDDDKALAYADYLSSSEGSPWIGKINMANDSDKKGTVNQQSFVQAIKKHVLVSNNYVASASKDKELDIFKNYWIAIQNVIDVDDDSVLFKYNGAFLFCMFSVPFLNLLLTKKDFKVQTMEKLLKKTFGFLDGDFAGVGHAGYWEKGSTASFMNAGGLNQINKALIEALYHADRQNEEDFEV